MSDVLVKFENVNKSFLTQEGNVSILKNINFEIKKNTFTILFGPSGSGKTTILNIILGLLPPSSGKVKLLDQDLYKMNQNERAKFRAQHFGSVYQTNDWIGSLDVIENIALPLYLTGMDKNSAIKQAMDSLKRVGFEKYANYSPRVLSIGQQQQISLARATVTIPLLLLADEPTGNLDSKNGDRIMQLITSYKNEHNSTIILVTHNAEYLPLSDHRLFIADGVVTEDEGGYMSKINDRFDNKVEMAKEAKTKKKAKNGK